MDNFKIFISYSWKDKDIVDSIDKDFQAIGISFERDERSVNYHESFKQFMKKVREVDYVLMVLSDDYLKSKNCMYEVLEFIKDDNYKERILHIVLDNCDIYSIKDQANYILFWEKQLNELQDILSTLNPMNTVEQHKSLGVIQGVSKNIGEFICTIADMKNIPLYELKNQNYKPLLDFIGFKDKLDIQELMKIVSMNDNEEQDIALEKYAEKHTMNDRYYSLKATIERKRGNYKKSKFYCEKAIEINPSYANAHNNLAILLKDDYFKDYKGAKEHYEKAIELNPSNAIAHYNLAILLEHYYKDKEEAKKYLFKAIELNPEILKNFSN